VGICLMRAVPIDLGSTQVLTAIGTNVYAFLQSRILAQKADTDQETHKNWRLFQNAI
jgi:hypothetical protein